MGSGFIKGNDSIIWIAESRTGTIGLGIIIIQRAPDSNICYIACAIKALRWAYLSAYFYRGRIASQLYAMAYERRLGELGHYIQDCVDQSKWIFDTASTGQIVIAQTGKIRIAYDETLHRYTLAGDCECTFERYEDCLSFVTANYPDLQLSGTFDLGIYVQALREVLTSLENMSCTQV